MNTETYPLKANNSDVGRWLWRAGILAATIILFLMYGSILDVYEVSIVIFTAIGLGYLGQSWVAYRWHILSVTVLSLLAVKLYGQDLGLADSNFWLKYILASQSALSWMSALFVMATLAYFAGLFSGSEFSNRVASFMTWSATSMGMVGLMVRWRESYLMGTDIGHIPVSNLYEVFILFSVITALLYLFYERRYKTHALGGFVLLVVTAAVIFQLWYASSRGADEIQPLVPALQSYWMKIHVPANFIGYGAFAMAAMIGVAYLIVSKAEQKQLKSNWLQSMPSLNVMDDVMYKAIALGFAFFTVATILGALWAAEAWGGYWSWDPKETWALIVWLNYAAWLHMRMTKGWHGSTMAWWSIVGLFVTLFAFLGVNMFLSGLHSYGSL